MKLVGDAIRYPVSTAVGVLLVLLFGSIALTRIPVQLVPTVEEPQVSVTTFWPGASPQEVEREIVDEQEEHLKSLEGLVRMESTSSDSRGTVNLTFRTGSDIDAALLRVSNRLQQVPSYPQDAERPVLATISDQANAIAWFLLAPAKEREGSPPPFAGDISTLFDFAEDFIKPEIERVPGVARSEMFGGREREMQVIVDPAKLAGREVTLTALAAALDRENRNWSGGDLDEGKRRYVVRTVGDYTSTEDIEDVVIAMRGGVPIYVRDVARVELGYRRWDGRVFAFGEPKLAINAQREIGANVLDVMVEVREAVDRVNEELLRPRGLELVQVYDETDYISSSIGLVRQSLVLGGILAALVLLLFLRSITSTLVVAVAIPISAVGTFLMMELFGRSLNVVSLAGMAFAVGMVVDNSIVVLENIYRHRQMGKSRATAAFDGAREVWGAVLASTATTVAVFLPVVFIEEEAGQLFRDIAIAISCGVALSLLVAITVIPSLSAKILSAVDYEGARGVRGLWGGVALARRLNRLFAGAIDWLCRGVLRRVVLVTVFVAATVGLSLVLLPDAEYLPTGNLNFIVGIMSPPPGYNMTELETLQKPFVDELGHLWTTPPEEAVDLPGGGVGEMFFILAPGFTFVAVSSNDPLRARELIGPFYGVASKIPGAITFVTQSSIFQRDLGRARNVEVNLTGPELEPLLELGREVFGRVRQAMPDAQSRPIPDLTLGSPEIRIITDRRRAADLGLSNRDLGIMVSALVDGFKASDYRYEGREIDLKVRAELGETHRTHLLEQMPIATPDGRLVTLGSVAQVVPTTGPTEIRHFERDRSVTIAITPPDTMALQTAMGKVEDEVLTPLRAEGRLSGLYRARLAGTADKLVQTGRVLVWNFVLAVVITYLLMSALFEDFLYPLVILVSVPLAAFGGFLGLRVLNLFTPQAMDVLTMLGFIILVGTVVNNAILIVHQTLNHLREESADVRQAVREATTSRVRPIFMSVLTSVCGMLPLVLFPGAGSELYRGLGSVVVGGLLVSTLFTLILVPSLLSLVLDARGALARRLGSLEPADQTAGG